MNIRAFALSPMVMAIGLTVGLSACHDSNSSSKATEAVTNPQRSDLAQPYMYQLVFENIATGEPITDELQVKLTGPAVDAGLVVDANNVSVKGQTLTTNIGTVSVAADYDASNTSFSVLVGNSATGWSQTGMQLSQDTSVAGNQTLVLKLINPSQAAAINANEELALSIATKTFAAAADGAVTDALVTLSTPSKQSTSDEGDKEDVGTTTISLPAGVNALDANGQKINLTGDISATTVKFGNSSASSMSAFPGGFAPTVVDETGATDKTGAFITGGFAQFNLTDSTGTALKRFDKPVTLTIDLPKTSAQPDGTALVAGATYPVWSYDESTGKWQFEANGLISEKTPVDANNFAVSFESTHLSYWNLDFLGRTCSGTLNLQRSAQDTRALSVELVGVRGQRFFQTFYDVRDAKQVFARYPIGLKVNVIVRDEQNAILARSTTAQNLCAGGSVTIPAPPAVTRANLIVNVTESCPSGTNRRPSPTFVYFYDGRRWQSGYARTNTSANVARLTFDGIRSGTVGKVYAFNPLKLRYDEQSITVNSPNTTATINFADLNCKPVTGATGTSN